MDLKHDKESVSETMSLSEPKYEIKRDPYHEATLVYSGQNSQGTRSYHTERVNVPSVSNSVIHSIHGILTKVFKTHSVTTDLIDSSYLYGAGIDLQWNTLWSYRSIHGQTRKPFPTKIVERTKQLVPQTGSHVDVCDFRDWRETPRAS